MAFIDIHAIERVRRVALLAATLAVAPVVLSAVAHADPDPNPNPDPGVPVDARAQCESPEFGGVYVMNATTPDAITHGVCQYIVEGQFYYDNYDNGAYTGTLVYRDGAKVPTERPAMPELLTSPDQLPMVPFPGQF